MSCILMQEPAALWGQRKSEASCKEKTEGQERQTKEAARELSVSRGIQALSEDVINSFPD